MDGILPLWKPRGLTSHDCVMKVRRLYKTKKVGHTGTLDPEVEGVLPICIGQATKIVPYLTDTKKVYHAEISLGQATETEDNHGKVVDSKQITNEISRTDIESTLKKFKGMIKQIPPMYSAVKVNGKKLYEYAREGRTVDRPVRQVTVYNLDLLSELTNYSPFDQRFRFRVECSKGTYIRTLCVDIGNELGYPAHMSHLVRKQTGNFNSNNSYTFDQIKEFVEAGIGTQLLVPIYKGVEHLDVVYIDSNTVTKVSHGQKLALPENQPKTDIFRVQYKDKLIALYQIDPKNNQLVKPVRVFQ